MSATTAAHADETSTNYLSAAYGLKSWLLTRDHKRVAILYLIATTSMFVIGGFLAGLMRLELMTPQGDLLNAETYNRTFTQHGVGMIFFFLIPAIPAVLGNFLVPIMIGARSLAFPRLNLLSWYLYFAGGTLALIALALGGVETGWTFYPPFSSSYSHAHIAVIGLGLFSACLSSILTGVNFITTIHQMRAPGMTWLRLPLFIWSHYAASLIQVAGTPVLAIGILLIAAERLLSIGIFDPALGGDPLLFQHMFWFYSTAALYVMALPAMGIVSELIACFSRKRILGYASIAFASLAIAVLNFFTWGQHMYASGQSIFASMIFSFFTFLMIVPAALVIFNWLGTLYRGAISLEAPMLFALGFMALFIVGGMTGLMLATLGLNIHLHDTHFVVAHFHYMVGGVLMAYLGGLHFWWPKMTGRLYHGLLARGSAVLVFAGFNLTFLPLFIMGILGMPRRVHTYPEEFQLWNVMSTSGATILVAGVLIGLLNLVGSLFLGDKAKGNPWKAKGLEWQISSPPNSLNFIRPPVAEEAYAYGREEG